MAEIDPRIVVFREHRQLGDDERQIARQLALETVADFIRPEDLAFLDIANEDADALMAFGRKQAEGVADILGGKLAAVRKSRLFAQSEGDTLAVGGDVGGLCDEPVDGIGLVIGARHERIEEELDILRRVALEERSHGIDPSALGGIGIDVIEMGELGWIFEIAEGRNAVPRLGDGRQREPAQKKGRQDFSHHFAAATFLAFSSSHHQRVGNPIS